MAQKKKTNQSKVKKDARADIAEAALFLASRQGWADLTLKDIAKKAQMPVSAVEKHFADIWDILLFILARVENETEKSVADYMGSNWRDNLMEIMMTRFDIAGLHREAFCSLPVELPRHPRLLKRLAKPFYATMRRMMELADVPDTLLHKPAVAAFALLYISVVHTWTKDDSADKTKTMAALDKRLGIFESLAGYLQCPPLKKAG